MAGNNPVQIVLNDSDYIKAPEPGRGGPPFDFFAGKDVEFVKHKAKISTRLASAAAALRSSGVETVGYVRVKLRQDALAKSHRPSRVMFEPTEFSCVGAAGLGELYYLASARQMSRLIDAVSEAEPETNWVEDQNGKLKARPTPIRSDVGAIEDISVPEPEAKRNFDTASAIEWLSDPRTGGFYLVELFENPVAAEKRDKRSRGRLAESLEDLIKDLGTGVVAWRMPEAGGEMPLALRLTGRDDPPRLSSFKPEGDVPSIVSLDPIRHEEALQRLARHPSVRRISLPLKIELTATTSAIISTSGSLPSRSNAVRYPRVGVVDSGLGPALADWTLGRHDFLEPTEVDEEHGSFVGGLLVGAQSLNPTVPGLEADGCELVDLALFPRAPFMEVYPGGFSDFLDEMDQAIGEAVSEHKTRIFNLSINAVSAVEPDEYSYYAARLDQISARHDVILVNSAGNLAWSERRSPWPKRAADALKYFAGRAEADTIHKPSESYRAVSVGALNPPGCSVHHDSLPATYSRRGPGLKVGTKPDVAHYGGNDGSGPLGNHGLVSTSPTGSAVSNCGTSFAAPLIAKSLAALEGRIEGNLPSHALRALLLHNCDWPKSLSDRRLAQLARQFTGYGLPCPASDMLVTDDSSITLVFNSRLPDDEKRPKVLRFDFQWPQALVDPVTGACRGEAKATLVYEPPIDRAFGAEFVRINLDAKLQQRQLADRQDGLPSYRDCLAQGFLPKAANQPIPEKELINQGLKWWPTKRYRSKIPKAGIGASSEWRIEVAALKRAEAVFPAEGVPFTLVMTIRDPNGELPIFPQLRRTLQAGLVKLEDLRTYQRIRAS